MIRVGKIGHLRLANGSLIPEHLWGVQRYGRADALSAGVISNGDGASRSGSLNEDYPENHYGH